MLSRVFLLAKQIGLLLGIYLLLRLTFLGLNFHYYSQFTVNELLQAFIHGLRFDTSAIVLVNLPLILLSLLPAAVIPPRVFKTLSHGLLLLLNVPFILLNCGDSEYYKFSGTRLTSTIFHLRGEATAQGPQFLVNYWYIVLLFLVFSLALHFFSPSVKHHRPVSPWFGSLLAFLVVAFALVGARGGVQEKVIQPSHAFKTGSVELGHLALNSTFTLIKSRDEQRLHTVHFFDSKNEYVRHLQKPRLGDQALLPDHNVVVLILESFATEFWGAANEYPGYTPFLDSLAKKGLFFVNNFANGRRSIEALPSILLGVPSLMEAPLVKTNYQNNSWRGVGSFLQSHNYHTSFFHGAPTGTMYFDALAAMGGLKHQHSLDIYPLAEKHFDGNWGAYDEPYLQYMVEQLNNHPQPFFATVFTLTTHQPYSVPPEYRGRFPKGPLKIHESVGYVDYALQKFFESASKQPWHKKTLYIITGDHTQMSAAEFYNHPLGRFRVPLLLYHPEKNLSHPNLDRVTQHADILPTVLDILGIRERRIPLFGRSVMDTDTEGEALLHLDGNYWLVQQNRFLLYNPINQSAYLYQYPEDQQQAFPIKDEQERVEDMKKRIQAYIQYYAEGLINNSLYDWASGASSNASATNSNSANLGR